MRSVAGIADIPAGTVEPLKRPGTIGDATVPRTS